MRAQPFGESSRGLVQVLTIGSEPGPVLEVLDLGATVHRLWVTGGDGVRRNVVLGHATPEEHLESVDYVGGTIGRYAKRIRAGRFPLDGRRVQVATNDRGNHLHGGRDRFHQRIWEVLHQTDDQLTLKLTSPGGDQGFPGELIAVATFTTTENSVQLLLGAITDEPTVVNLTSHAYFNLDGDGSGLLGEQRLRVVARAYLPVDALGMPLDPGPVAGTGFDLRDPARLREAIERTGGLDHNYVLDRGSAVPPGRGSGPRATAVPGHTPNRPEFGSAVRRPGERYHARLEWRFVALAWKASTDAGPPRRHD